jgi:hypothetical protein
MLRPDSQSALVEVASAPVRDGRFLDAGGCRYHRAYYDKHKRVGNVVDELQSGWEIAFPPSAIQGLDSATEDDLDDLELTPSDRPIGQRRARRSGLI